VTIDGQKVKFEDFRRGLRDGSLNLNFIALPGSSFSADGITVTRSQWADWDKRENTRVWQDTTNIVDAGSTGFGFTSGAGTAQQQTTPVSGQDKICNIQVFERGIEALKGAPIPGAKHGYIVLTDAEGQDHVFEGKNVDGRLMAVDDFKKVSKQLPGNNPKKNKKRGEKSGSDVCDWLSILENDASQVNAVDIKYNFKGPNSNSVLRFMLQSLPDQSWYKMPRMVGWKYKLPRVEP
jgi:hypothetical protein